MNFISMSITSMIPLWNLSRRSSADDSKRNRRCVITPVGWAVISLTAASTLAFPWTHWHELLVIAVTGILMLVSGVVLSLPPSRCHVTLKPKSSQLSIQDAGRIVLTASNPHQINALATEAIVTIDDRQYHCAIPSLSKDTAHQVAINVVPQRRGLIHVGPVLLRAGDPMGLLHRFRSLSVFTTITVIPRIVPLPSFPQNHESNGQNMRNAGTGVDDFHGLRAYSQGDDPRHIHWKVTAKTGQLITRQYATGENPAMILMLDTETSHYRNEDEFELAVSVFASIGAAILEQQHEHPVIIGTSSSKYSTIGSYDDSDSLLEACAAVPRYDDAQTQHAPSQDVTHQHVPPVNRAYVMPEGNNRSSTILITGSTHPPIPLLRETIHKRMSLNGTINNIVIIDRETSSSLQVQGSSHIIHLSTLNELPDLLRRWLP